MPENGLQQKYADYSKAVFGLNDEIINAIVAVIAKSKVVSKAVIFGSRARGDFRYNSDIDIALYTDGEPHPGLFMDIDDAAGECPNPFIEDFRRISCLIKCDNMPVNNKRQFYI